MNRNEIPDLLKASPVGFVLFKIFIEADPGSVDYHFLECNASFRKITGLAKENLSGKTLRQIFSCREISDSGLHNLFEVMAGNSETAEFEYFNPVSQKWIIVNAWQTDSTHIAVTTTEKSTRIGSPEHDEMKTFTQHPFWDNDLFGVMIADKYGNYQEANEEACRMTGYSGAELKSMTLFQLVDPENVEEIHSRFEQLKQTGRSFGEHAYFTKSGEKRWWNLMAIRISDEYFLGIHEDVTARRIAEDQLREEKEHHFKVISNISDVIWEYEVDSAGSFIRSYISPVADSLLGLPSGTTGYAFENYFRYIHPDDLQLVIETLHRSMLSDEKKIHRVEYRLITHDGSLKYVSSSGIVHVVPNGNRLAYGITSDITERKEAENSLRLQSLVLDQIQDRVTVTDLEGRITYVNDAEVRTLGYPREELIGAYTEKYGDDPSKGASQRQILEETLKHGEWRCEVVNRSMQGEEVILDCRTQVVHDERGNRIAIAGIATDITDRKRAEEELQVKNLAIETALNAIAISDLSGILTYVNASFLRLWGYTKKEDVLGRMVLDFWKDTLDPSAVIDALQHKGYWMGEMIAQRSDGSLFEVELSANLVRDQKGFPLCMQGSFIDITDRKRAEETLKTERMRLAGIIEATNIGTWEWNVQTGETIFNERWAEIIGYTFEEISPVSIETWVKFAHPEDLKKSEDLIEKHFNTDFHVHFHRIQNSPILPTGSFSDRISGI
jgi:PAS domain S-box-containing protein